MKNKKMLNSLKTRELWFYASGEGASSITMNGIGNFAMLFYAQILGMPTQLVGIALFVATIWDAITDPMMGTISDRTNSRFGRRHPYMLIGGTLLALSFLAMWFVPEAVRGERALFVYLLILNIIVRTAFTIFVVPYTALGFEMCRTDNDRARLQGVRFGFNMIVNIIFGGMAWVLFFPDQIAEDGTVIDGTRIHAHYLNMGSVLALSAFLLILFCVYTTYKYAHDTPFTKGHDYVDNHFKAFINDLKDVYSDKLVWFVFGFFGLAQFSMMVVSQVQMFTYVEYMRFSALEKTFVHTGGMVGFMLGALFLGSLVKRLDKKKTGYLAMATASLGGLLLLTVFTGGLMDPQARIGPFPIAAAVFGVLQFMWWGGCGIIVPLAVSMIADLSLIKRLTTGEVTEGRYAGGFSFFQKAANALGLLVTGYILSGVGYVSGAEEQTVDTINNLALMTFIVGPILMLLSFLILRRYPVTHQFLDALRKKYADGHEETPSEAPQEDT